MASSSSRVDRWGGADDDEVPTRFVNDPREVLKDSNFLGARGLEVLGEVGAALLAEGGALAGENPVPVRGGGLGRIDPRDGQIA